MNKKTKQLRYIDPNLKGAIKDLIFNKNKYPNEDSLGKELQDIYPIYKRMKLNQLKQQIKQCLDEISNEDSEFEELTNDDNLMKIDNEINQKFIIDKKPSNMFNNSINELYKKTTSFNQSQISNLNQSNFDHSNLNTTTNLINESSNNITDQLKSSTTKKSIKKRQLDDDDEDKIDKVLNKQLRMKNKYIKDARFNFNDFAGLEDKIKELKRFVIHFKMKESFFLKDYKSLLIHGPTGVGKTSLVEAVANHLNVCLLNTKLNSINNNEKVFNELIELAKLNESDGCIILLDEIDSIGLKVDGSNLERDRNIIVQLKDFLDNLPEFNEKKILVIATTNKYEKLDSEIINLFDFNMKLNLPNQQARLAILNLICNKYLPNLDQLNLDLNQLSKKTLGYVAKDYFKLFIIAKFLASERYLLSKESSTSESIFNESTSNPTELLSSKLNVLNQIDNEQQIDQLMEEENKSLNQMIKGISNQDIEDAFKLYTPISKLEGFANTSNISWNDIGALKEAKNLLQSCIIARVKYKEIAESMKLNKPVGILMYGPPGCGKTMLAKAIANEAEINFISVGGPEILNKYVGESERAVRELFLRANKLKPCLIFFDEFDSISSSKFDSGNDVTRRVIKQLLVEMDGYDSRTCFMLAATNRPDLIDPAILRPGRFNKAIYIGVPNAEERVDILKTITKNGQTPKCSSSVDFDKIGKNPILNGFSGADLNELVESATQLAFDRFIKTQDPKEAIIKEEDFEISITKIKPSLDEKQAKKYEEYRSKFENIKK